MRQPSSASPVTRKGVRAGPLQKRDSTVSVPFELVCIVLYHHEERVLSFYRKRVKHFPLYAYNVTLGTPPQEIEVQLDTGSGFLAVTASNSSICQHINCIGTTSFNVSASSTYKFMNHDFNITYPLDRTLSGDFATDTLTIAGIAVPDMQLGIDYSLAVPEYPWFRIHS